MKYGLNRLALGWTENWLNCCTQRAVISGTKPNCRVVTGGIP